MNKVRWVIHPSGNYIEVNEEGKWINYKQSKHYQPEHSPNNAKGFRTMQNCLKDGYTMVEALKKDN